MVGIFQLIGIMIPFAGMIALVKRKQQSESSTKLLVATVGCLIMNSGYLLFITSDNSESAMTALKMEYLGSALFYFFFVQFLMAYQEIKIPEVLVYIWGALECAVAGIYWQDALRENLFGRFLFEQSSRFGYMTVQIEQSVLYLIRYCALSFVLLAGLVYGMVLMIQKRVPAERNNMARLVGSQFVILSSLMIEILLNPVIDIVPMCTSLSLLSMVVSIHKDGFFGIKDWGHEWVFEEMEDIYIAADCFYGFIDANPSAKMVFPELKQIKEGASLEEEILHIFTGEESVYKIKDKFYERNITEIVDKGKLAGHTILLRNITEQQEHLELVQNYNVRLEKEVAEKTRHIQLVQDSIITGIASVVASRDNSTGDHVKRAKAVVKVLSSKLEESSEVELKREFLETVIKVAPMHDLGKVAIDDSILRKPGKLTEEEYRMMKSHSVEGSRVIRKVLAEVDDEAMMKIALNVARFHHERWDGKGYPDGLVGEQIPIEARIMALADVFDALASKRYYKEALSFEKVFSIIEEGLGTQFDPVLGKIFLECRPELEKLYLGWNQE